VPDIFHRHMTQRVPSDPHWMYNCQAYCGAMLIHDATLGGVMVTGRIIRALSSEPKPDPNSPGLNLTQIIDVARSLYIPLDNRTGENWGAIEDALLQGRRVSLSVDYDEMGKYQAQKAGTFDHQLVLIRPASEKDHTRASDPLASQSRVYPNDVLQQAARSLARRTGVSKGLRWACTRPVPLTATDFD
jgi:hypothetical protein